MALDIIRERVDGYRVIYGTEHSIKTQIVREKHGRYRLISGLCNGIPTYSAVFPRLQDALRYGGWTD